MIVGGLGVALSLKHFEWNRFHAEVMWQVQTEIQRLRQSSPHDAAQISELWQAAKDLHRIQFSVWRKSPDQRLGNLSAAIVHVSPRSPAGDASHELTAHHR